jgi:anti-sigma B factor antagonist
MATTERGISAAGVLTIRVVPEDPYRIQLFGELDGSNAGLVEHELELAEASTANRIVLDLGPLAFIDSTGLRVLLMAKRRSDADNDRLRIRRGRDQVMRVLALTGIDAYLEFDEEEDPLIASEPAR